MAENHEFDREESKQKRVGTACEECRKRKRKCDGAKPTCSLCIANTKVCHYPPEETARKRKLNLAYVSDLEDQVSALKAYVRELEDFRAGIGEARDGEWSRSVDEDVLDASQDTAQFLAPLSTAVDEVASMMWKINVADSGDVSFHGPSGNFCFPTPPSNSRQVKTVASVPMNSNVSFVTCAQDTTLKLYLLGLFTQYIKPPHQFVEAFALESVALGPDEDAAIILLRTAIFAAASCLSDRPDAEQIGQSFSAYAESIALQCCRARPTLAVVQAFSILCWCGLSREDDNMAWMYNSMAASLATHLGLHVDSLENLLGTEPHNLVPTESEKLRIKTFWQSFLIDRIATSLLGRQCAIPWKRVKTRPFEVVLGPSATIEEIAFDHQCKLWLLHDQFMDQIYSFEFTSLDFSETKKLLMNAREKLLSFHEGIDHRLCIGKEVRSSSVGFFQMSYQMSLLLIHRPYLREPSTSQTYRLALRSMTAAASWMTRIIRSHRKIESLRHAPFFIVHHVLTAAILHLLSTTSTNAPFRQQSITRFRTCVEALDEMRPTSSRAQSSIRLLQELAKRWSVVFALPMRFSYLLDGDVPDTTTKDFGEILENHAQVPPSWQQSCEAPRMVNIPDPADATTSTFDFDNLISPDIAGWNTISIDADYFNELDFPVNLLDSVGLDWLTQPD